MANQHTKAAQTAEEVHVVLSRVSSLETGMDSLSNDVRSLARSLEGFAAETRTAIGQLSQKMADGQKTPWGVLFAGMGVVLTIISLVGGLVAYGMQTDLLHTRDLLRQEIQLRAVPSVHRLDALETRVVGNSGKGWHRPDQERYADKMEALLLLVDKRLRALEQHHCGAKKE